MPYWAGGEDWWTDVEAENGYAPHNARYVPDGFSPADEIRCDTCGVFMLNRQPFCDCWNTPDAFFA